MLSRVKHRNGQVLNSVRFRVRLFLTRSLWLRKNFTVLLVNTDDFVRWIEVISATFLDVSFWKHFVFNEENNYLILQFGKLLYLNTTWKFPDTYTRLLSTNNFNLVYPLHLVDKYYNFETPNLYHTSKSPMDGPGALIRTSKQKIRVSVRFWQKFLSSTSSFWFGRLLIGFL